MPCLIYQGRYSILDREVADSGILDKACDAGVGFIGFSPLAQGLLTDRYLNGIPSDSRMAVGNHLKQDVLSEKMLATIKTLNTIAGQRGEALSDMALAWILADKRVTSVIIGASSVPQLATNLKALSSAPFTQEELEMIDAACR